MCHEILEPSTLVSSHFCINHILSQFDCLMFPNFSALEQVCQWLNQSLVRGVAGAVTVSPFYLLCLGVCCVLFLRTWKLWGGFVDYFVFLVAVFHENFSFKAH